MRLGNPKVTWAGDKYIYAKNNANTMNKKGLPGHETRRAERGLQERWRENK